VGLLSPPHGGVDRNLQHVPVIVHPRRRPLTGAWIETATCPCWPWQPSGRPLTGAWIETTPLS